MASSKVLLCDLCIIMVIGITFVLSEDRIHTTSGPDSNKGNCSCGGFPKSKIEANEQPMLSQAPGLLVKCDTEGETTCKNLCNALATATKAKGPEVLCNRLKTVSELKLSAFFKVCELPWTYANMTADEPLCCEDSKVKMCQSMEKSNATDTIDVKTVM